MAFTLGKRRLFVATDVQCEDMLDAAAVADAVSQEVRFFVNGVQLDDPAITTPEGKIAQMQAVAYLPTSDEIAALAEPLFWASLLPEEGRATSFRVLVRNPDDMTDRFVPLIGLEPPIALDPRSMKKLAPAYNPATLTWKFRSVRTDLTYTA